MEDREFFDELYQLWSKTSHAKDRYWGIEEEDSGLSTIKAVGEDAALEVAWGLYEPDADFITAVHGCFPDLYRRLHAALDEADRADYERDSRECRIGELESEVADLKKIIEGLSKEPPWNG